MLRSLIAGALCAACLSGCAQVETAAQVSTAVSSYSVTQATVDGIRAGYVGAFLTPAVAYRKYCTSATPVTATCIANVRKLQAADVTVRTALANTQAQIAAGNTTGASAALATAKTAITAAESLAVTLGISTGAAQ